MAAARKCSTNWASDVAKKKPRIPPPALPPLTPSLTTRFTRDLERMRKRGEDLGRLRQVIAILCSREPLAQEYRDHPLKGEYKGWRDCHVSPDCLVIYRMTETELVLARTGTHSDLFE
ncbi:type II toxin-antitoxin system YafQ family toxin [Isosphaeraceae bacterium EP7]